MKLRSLISLLLLAWHIAGYATYAKKTVHKHWDHEDCATMKDPYYAAAVQAFDKASGRYPCEFPETNDWVFLSGEDDAFYYEGALN